MPNRFRTLLTLLPLLLIAGPAPQALAACNPPPGLDGHWKGTKEGDYYFREMPAGKVWMVGMDSATSGETWTIEYHGPRTGDHIRGNWVTVRGNPGSGFAGLLIQGVKMTRVAGTLRDKYLRKQCN